MMRLVIYSLSPTQPIHSDKNKLINNFYFYLKKWINNFYFYFIKNTHTHNQSIDIWRVGMGMKHIITLEHSNPFSKMFEDFIRNF